MKETEYVTAHDKEQFDSVLEIKLAIERREVTFPMVVKALYFQFWANGALRDLYQELYPRALSQFMTEHGGINESFYAREFAAGVVLTGKGELFFNIMGWDQFVFDTIPARTFEADINDLLLKAELYLSENHARICKQRLFRLYKGLISSLYIEYSQNHQEGKISPDPAHIADLKQLRRELEGVKDTYRRVGLARGQWRYLTGAGLGAVVIAVLAGIAAAILGTANHHIIWLGALAGGAVGALLSVLERLTRGALRVGFEAEAEHLIISGISRPVVGAISGVALFVLIGGNVALPFIKASENSQGLFFMGVAFLAGFSERLAKDVLGNAVSSITEAKQEPAAANEVTKPSSEDAAKVDKESSET